MLRHQYGRRPRLAVLIGIALFALVFSTNTTRAVTLHLLPIGDPGNAVDPRPGAHLGAVNYSYSLDKYDVTNSQYAEFLNAKASAADPYGLYDSIMASDIFQGGITRSASAPYTYTVKAGFANKPVVSVSWFDAIRFTNWLTNGQGSGDTESGSYLITAGGPNAGVATVPTAAERAVWASSSLHYLLPSADEWYKAAFYKGGGTDAGYWSYPLTSDTQPRSTPPGFLLAANILDNSGNYAVPGPIHLTDVGAYLSTSPYGHFDMAGNVFQFTDTPYAFDPTQVVLRGSIFGGSADGTSFQASSNFGRGFSEYDLGFRVAAVPEPSSLPLAALAALGLLYLRRRRLF
jgi:formylglycine-generating enzyme